MGEDAMNKGKRIRFLLAPLFFMVLLFVPGILLLVFPNSYLQGDVISLWNPFVLLFGIVMVIWAILFCHISTVAYIAILVIYSIVSWIWILKQKKGNLVFLIVWVALCVFTVLFYWKLGPEYSAMVYG